MGIFERYWIDFLIRKEKEEREIEKNQPRPFVQPQIPVPTPKMPEIPKDKEKKDNGGAIIIDI